MTAWLSGRRPVSKDLRYAVRAFARTPGFTAAALLSIALGIGAFGLTRSMQSLLFGVNAFDPLTFTTIPLLLAAIALLASWLPARRAARIDPTISLRNE